VKIVDGQLLLCAKRPKICANNGCSRYENRKLQFIALFSAEGAYLPPGGRDCGLRPLSPQRGDKFHIQQHDKLKFEGLSIIVAFTRHFCRKLTENLRQMRETFIEEGGKICYDGIQ